MSRQARIAALIALVAGAAVAFVALRPTDDGAVTTSGQSATVPSSTRPTVTTPAIPVVRRTITVDGDGPVGGVADIRANAGDRVVIEVRSTGYVGEAHLHGFDIHADIAPGRPGVINVPAKLTAQAKGQGSFEIELEEIAVRIAQLIVSP